MSSWLWSGIALSWSGELMEFYSYKAGLGHASAHKPFLDAVFPS